jgi:hypothetical protein
LFNFLTQLKRAKVGCLELVQFFKSCIRSLIEYACPVYHDGLPTYLSRDLETIQRRAMRIIYPTESYEDIYVIYRLGGPDRKIFCRGLENGRRPRDVFETETKYFSIRTDLNGK